MILYYKKKKKKKKKHAGLQLSNFMIFYKKQREAILEKIRHRYLNTRKS